MGRITDTPPRHQWAQRATSLPWANEIPYGTSRFIGLISLYCLLVIVLFWGSDPLSRAIQNIMAFGYLFVAVFRLSACLTPRPVDLVETARTRDHLSTIIPLHPGDSTIQTPDTDSDLPTITIFLPLYREAAVVKPLTDHLRTLDYPADKLEICLLCETDDHDTLAAVPANLPDHFMVCVVPDTKPKTKPKALNVGLTQTRGAIVTIYDAEDRPDPSQLRAAVNAFRAYPHWDALQAPLVLYNARQKFLTRQFALEYAALFYVWLPFLARLSCPFPLGGTSNFVHRSALERLGGWDSYNVTEDADLGFRLGACGGHIGYINPATSEESVENWTAWHHQRSRWMKGFFQTWRVQMKAAVAPGGWAGIKRQLTLQITLGVTLFSSLFHLPFIAYITALWLSSLIRETHIIFEGWTLYCLVLSYLAGILMGLMGAIRSQQFRLIPSLIWMPFYWLALFIPAIGALWELKDKPFYWNKTEHGVTDAPH